MKGLKELQARFEGSRAGRVAISVFLLATLAAIVVTSLPGSSIIHQRLKGTTQPYLNAVGLDQNWGVFAPDPRRQVIELEARLTYIDGHTATWRLPDGGPLLGAAWDYRWRKFVEYATSPEYERFWPGIAGYIAREEERGGRPPTIVGLVSRFREILPPGEKTHFGPWKENLFYERQTPADELEVGTR